MKMEGKKICLLMILLSLYDHGATEDVYVVTKGSDVPSCGRSNDQACKTIRYAMQKLDPSVEDVKLYLTASGKTPFAINSNISLDLKSFEIIGDGGYPTITSAKNQTLFVFKPRHRTFSFTAQNVIFYKCPTVLEVTNLQDGWFEKKKDTWYGRSSTNTRIVNVNMTDTKFVNMHLSAIRVDVGNVNSTTTLDKCSVVGNYFTTAGFWHRVGSNSSMTIRVTESEFIDNKAKDFLVGIRDADYVNTVEVTVTDTLFIRNQVTQLQWAGRYDWKTDVWYGVRQGQVFVNVNKDNSVNIRFERVKSIKNKVTYGGQLALKMQDQNNVTVNFINSVYLLNRAMHEGGLTYVVAGKKNRIYMNMTDIACLNTTARDGGILYLVSKRENNLLFHATYSYFYFNLARYGAVQFFYMRETLDTFTINVNHCVYMGNYGNASGGALLMSTSDATKNTCTVTVRNTSFINNFAYVRGAAFVMNPEYDNNFKGYIYDSLFVNNTAAIGGALSSKDSHIEIHNSTFLNNSGNTGGTIYVQGMEMTIIQNSYFTTDKKNLVEISTKAELTNTTWELLDNGYGINMRAIQVFIHQGKSMIVRGLLKVQCPMNYQADHKYMHVVIHKDFEQVENKSALAYLSVSCRPCPKGNYTIRRTYYWYDPKLQNGFFTNISCQNCPSSGDCETGRLIALTNVWGYAKYDDVYFIHCPIGYCNDIPTSFDTCESKRKGTLCGNCKDGHSLNAISNKCIPDNVCQHGLQWLSPLVILPLFMIITFMFGPDIKTGIKNSILRLKDLILCKKHNVEDEETQEEQQAASGSFFAKLRLIYTFYQLQRFTKVPSTNKAQVLRNLQYMLANIFNMNLVDMETEDNDKDSVQVCPYKGFTFVHKKGLNLFMWGFPLSLCATWYILVLLGRACGVCKPMMKSLKWRLENCMIQLLLMSFIPLSTSFLELTHCVTMWNIVQMDILFSQGDVVCYNWWQQLCLLSIFAWVLPFFISLYVGIYLLELNKTTWAVITIGFPPAALIHMVSTYKGTKHLYVTTKKKEPELELDVIQIEPPPKDVTEGEEEEQTAFLHRKEMEAKYGEYPEELDDDPTAIQPETEFDQKALLYEMIQGPFRLLYWPSIEIIRRFMLVFVFVFFDFIALRLYLLGVVILVFLVILIKKKPYHDPIMSRLDISLAALLLILNVVSLFDTMAIYHVPETDDSRALNFFFGIFKVLVMIMPLVLLGMFTGIQKYHLKKELEAEEREAAMKMFEDEKA